MTDLWLLVFLPLAALSGWYSGRKEKGLVPLWPRGRLSADYFASIKHLLEEQPDQAIDMLTKMLTVDSQTIEIHLALGRLFRRRGEVDRAIRVHQNLLARPDLNKHHYTQSTLALAEDYLYAGLLDRAERLFKEVLSTDEYHPLALRSLLDIYQQQKNWQQAVDVSERVCKLNRDVSEQQRLAHYYCELAAIAELRGDIRQAILYLKHALGVHHNLVRANLTLGRIYMMDHDFDTAILCYQNVLEQDPHFLVEILVPLAQCYQQLQREDEYAELLQTYLQEYPQASLMLALADYLRSKQNISAAIDFLTTELRVNPSLRGLHKLIELQLANAENTEQHNLVILQRLLTNLLKNKPVYRCEHCGLNGKVLYWLCPSCKSWGTIKPIQGLEGE